MTTALLLVVLFLVLSEDATASEGAAPGGLAPPEPAGTSQFFDPSVGNPLPSTVGGLDGNGRVEVFINLGEACTAGVYLALLSLFNLQQHMDGRAVSLEQSATWAQQAMVAAGCSPAEFQQLKKKAAKKQAKIDAGMPEGSLTDKEKQTAELVYASTIGLLGSVVGTAAGVAT